MPTTQVKAGSGLQLQEVADIVGKSKKVVVVTGAGISTNCGIPVSWAQTPPFSLVWIFVDTAAGLSLRKWPVFLDTSAVRRSCTESALGAGEYFRHR